MIGTSAECVVQKVITLLRWGWLYNTAEVRSTAVHMHLKDSWFDIAWIPHIDVAHSLRLKRRSALTQRVGTVDDAGSRLILTMMVLIPLYISYYTTGRFEEPIRMVETGRLPRGNKAISPEREQVTVDFRPGMRRHTRAEGRLPIAGGKS